MPIDYKEYHPEFRSGTIHEAVVARSGNHCEECNVENGAIIKRDGDTYRYANACEFENIVRLSDAGYPVTRVIKQLGLIKIVLTKSHTDHNKHNNDLSNIRHLCQRCHLRHDMDRHIRNRKYGRYHRKFQLEIFG